MIVILCSASFPNVISQLQEVKSRNVRVFLVNITVNNYNRYSNLQKTKKSVFLACIILH